MSLLSGKSRIRWIPGLTREATWQYAQAGEKGYLSGFLNVLPDLESLTIDTDADRPPWMEKKLREMTSAKIVILETGDSCGYQP